MINNTFSIKTDKSSYVLRNAKVKIIKDTSGNIQIEYQGKKLEFTTFDSRPSFQAEIIGSKLINNEVDKLIKKPMIPSANHPWRKFNYGATANY